MKMSNIDRVKYNESSMFGWVKERIDIVFMGLDHVQSTNDIIEIYNVVKYIENIDSVDNLSAKDKSEYKKKLSILNKIIGKYFSNVTANNFDIYIENLYHDYVSDFWSLMCKFKKIREIEEEKFKNYLDVHPNHMNAILAQKDLSQQFADVIFQHLKDHPYGIRFIISSLFERKHQVQKTMYIRKNFSAEQLNALYTAYIKMENPNIHMLKLLRISQNDLQIGLDDEIRLLAKRKEEVLIEELSKSPSAVHIENKVGISFQDADQIPEVITEDRDKIIVYDGRWIRDNPDYPTLLNNFIYEFGYTDLQFRSSFPINRHQISAVDEIFMTKGLKTYCDSTMFSMQSDIYSLQMRGYIAQLQKINIDIEVVFKWFFESYLPEEFAVTGFYYNASSEGTSYLEKCKNIASEMERVLKQYRLYCKYGYIDPELFEMSSEHIIFSQLPSMQERKYIYPKSKQVQCCIADMFYNTMLCFSDDGLLNDFENFYEALSSLGRIDKKLLDRRSQKEAVHRLLLFGAIAENEGFYFLNPIKTAILKHFFDKDVLCYHYCESLQTTIDELLSADHLATENTLFSIPEQHYLDYILNKATYSDGLDLRNKYSHGSTSTNEVEHCKNYVEFLKIMVMIIIKINEEFCLKFPNQ